MNRKTETVPASDAPSNQALSHKQFTVLAAVFLGNDTPAEVTEAAELLHCRNCVDTLIERELLTAELVDGDKMLELTRAGIAIAKKVLRLKASAKPAVDADEEE